MGWLVTGAGGMLGRELVAMLRGEDEVVNGLARAGLDVTDAAAVREAICGRRPAVVVNCAAWTAVDDAETREEQALALNGHGAAHVAAAAIVSGTSRGPLPACLGRNRHGRRGCGSRDPSGSCPSRPGNRRPV